MWCGLMFSMPIWGVVTRMQLLIIEVGVGTSSGTRRSGQSMSLTSTNIYSSTHSLKAL